MAYGLSTNVMSKNVSRDKDMKGNLMAITTALEIMGINASSGWLEANGGESERLRKACKEIRVYHRRHSDVYDILPPCLHNLEE